jgi:lincosamide nucleotidyltransferase A/C/D/E
VQLSEVLAVTTALQEAGARFWVAGGWGVDALVGRVTRPHRDLDLAVAAEDLERAVERLAVLGYHPETDWLPVRLELAAPGGRWVDLHPVAFDGRGDGVQAGLDVVSFAYPAADLVVGVLEGSVLPCLSAARQQAFHRGYLPRPQDLHDLALLAGLAAPRVSERDALTGPDS